MARGERLPRVAMAGAAEGVGAARNGVGRGRLEPGGVLPAANLDAATFSGWKRRLGWASKAVGRQGVGSGGQQRRRQLRRACART